MFFIFLFLGGAVHSLIHSSIPIDPFPVPYPDEYLAEERQFYNPLLAINEDYLYIPNLTTPRIRKEFRELSSEEWKEYKNAVILLRKSGYLEPIARVHYTVRSYAHSSLEFLPWHRLFLLYYEYLLQSVTGNRNISVPYWDWTIDAKKPEDSSILKEFYWGIEKCFLVHEPYTHCLRRTSKKIDPFYRRGNIDSLIRKKCTFYEFTIELEMIPHALVHLNIGGETGDMSYMQSTNDPLFWHHHSFVELIWMERMEYVREKMPSRRKTTEYPEDKLEHILYPFNCTVREALEAGKYIQYERKEKKMR